MCLEGDTVCIFCVEHILCVCVYVEDDIKCVYVYVYV